MKRSAIPMACGTLLVLSAVSVAGAAARAVLPRDAASKLGIQILSVRLAANGNIVDLRYRVIDAEKAKVVLSRSTKPALKVAKTGHMLSVPFMPYVGSIRQNTLQPQEGRTYFALFANTGGAVKSGQTVTLIVGDHRVEGLVVS